MAAKFKKLQIKLLSKSGELLNCVNCFAGQVCVLRAVSANDLLPYQRAFTGGSGPENFLITLDDQEFLPEAHNLVGFGEQFLVGENKSVMQLLIDNGVPENSVESLLLTYGLDRVCHNKCSSISKDEERRVRLLIATYQQDKVLVLNNPFEPIATEWRERFAELVASYARSSSQIVVVTSLNSRPECWIDNEAIARVQVGENVQKTIGFATGPSSVHSIVDQVRTLIKDEKVAKDVLTSLDPAQRKASQKQAGAKTKDSTSEKARRKEKMPPPSAGGKKKIAALAVLGFSLSLAAAMGLVVVRSGGDPAKMRALLLGEKTPQAERDNSPLPATTEAEAKTVQVDLPPPPPPPPNPTPLPPQPEFVLDLYPASIRDSVIRAFDGSIAPSQVGSRPERERPLAENKTKNSNDLFQMLESTSGSGTNLPDSPPPSQQYNNDSGTGEVSAYTTEEQQKRELIRQKFLEAIERAAERRKQENGG